MDKIFNIVYCPVKYTNKQSCEISLCTMTCPWQTITTSEGNNTGFKIPSLPEAESITLKLYSIKNNRKHTPKCISSAKIRRGILNNQV